MSLLKPTPAPQPDQAKTAANQIRRTSKSLTDRLIKSVRNGLDDIWKAEDPAAVLEALGTDAVEAFALSRATIEFLAPILTASGLTAELSSLTDRVADIPAVTEHEDGTVTID